MRLSILICSVYERIDMLRDQTCRIASQIGDRKDVELLVSIDNLNQSIGVKRQRLIESAIGDYIVFIDDDDRVADFYIEEIMKAIETSPDCVGFAGEITWNGEGNKRFVHSLKYSEWSQNDNTFFRCPNHWNPIKRELALKAGFPDKNYGEDHDYSLAVRPFLETEVFIEREPIYHYLFKPKESLAVARRDGRR